MLLNIVVSIPTPIQADRLHHLQYLRCIIPVLMFLVALCAPFRSQECQLMRRLDPTIHGYQFRGMDFFTRIQKQKYLFKINSGELPETLKEITEHVSWALTTGVNSRGLV